MYGRDFNHELMSMLSSVGDWWMFHSEKTVNTVSCQRLSNIRWKNNVETVSCQHLVSTPFTKYCQDCLLLVFSKYSFHKYWQDLHLSMIRKYDVKRIPSRLPPVDICPLSDWIRICSFNRHWPGLVMQSRSVNVVAFHCCSHHIMLKTKLGEILHHMFLKGGERKPVRTNEME